ncbi:cyclopropane fatty acyl phospholipid synthase [Mucilaginibacter sp. 14171R-50]|uniref:cyclopropane fatty acyl phospholipid synthase n=1 Tax=Mucilaginibacter sp. 14171R-50 TaxID=2703789 RepID=UPI00138BEF43|nr:cyclopropane fatty acyl phospholipid synthase [Mucilaginibacter sp. 14171R-50]QHS55341.1 cyclopropane fatty acyl phospholipid synthase [Mucilaginibacter sp. 14171R-50]
MKTAPELVADLLVAAGIQPNGSDATDIRIKDQRFYNRVLKEGSLGLGESYMDGWWDCDKLDELIFKLLSANLHQNVKPAGSWFRYKITDLLFNRQTKRRARKVARIHYNLGNDLFEQMLGKQMMYSCGYWANASNLDEAQEHKLELICRKLKLEPGMEVLDIGCGWGGFAQYAASKYLVKVTGITISAEQAKLAQQRCVSLPVSIKLEDYRDLNGEYDRIVSIGMFEHVGLKNYRAYMKKVRQLLRKDGLFLLHTIGSADSSPTDPWIDRYIFPNGQIPSPAQLSAAFEPELILHDWHCFGKDYDRTVLAWRGHFQNSWPKLRDAYGDTFYRMWMYYLNVCAASFRAGKNSLWQLVFSRPGYNADYRSVR